jgi:hypothetical protein
MEACSAMVNDNGTANHQRHGQRPTAPATAKHHGHHFLEFWVQFIETENMNLQLISSGWIIQCITCGWRKADHTKSERFGKPCKKDLSGNCYQRGEFHD